MKDLFFQKSMIQIISWGCTRSCESSPGNCFSWRNAEKLPTNELRGRPVLGSQSGPGCCSWAGWRTWKNPAVKPQEFNVLIPKSNC